MPHQAPPEPATMIVSEPACFAVNLTLAADHEARIHRAFEPDEELRRRMALLGDVTAHARRLLRLAVR